MGQFRRAYRSYRLLGQCAPVATTWQRPAHQLFARLTHSAITTIDEQRVGDSLFRVMYDSVIAWGVVGGAIIYPFFTLVGYGLTLYQLEYTYGDVVPD